MKHNVQYKGFVIRSGTLKATDGDLWLSGTFISVLKRGSNIDRFFSSTKKWPTEKEALDDGINFGKQIIDGHVEHCSVAGL